jgi:hypothetical protein
MKPGDELEGGFSRRSVGWLIAVSLGSLVFGALLSTFSQNRAERPDPGANSFSRSAVGHHALCELLRREGIGVLSRRDLQLSAPGPHRPLILAEPPANENFADQLPRFLGEAARSRAPLVLVLPKWKTVPDPKHTGWIGAVVPHPIDPIERATGALALTGLGKLRIERRPGATVQKCRARLGGIETVYRIGLRRAQLIAPAPGLTPVVECGGALLVARTPGAPAVYLVADPDLIENHGLGTADHAALIHDLLVRELAAKEVIFDETIHGFARKPGLFAEAFRFPLVLATLQSLILAGVVLWAGMGRFGKPLPPRQALEGPETLIDNTARLLSRVKKGGHGHRGHP